jgi:carboxypeptidase family protein/TonB-dependent receptor-like protein
MRQNKIRAVITVILAIMILAPLWALPAYGQSDRGAITGTVTDTSGAIILGAKVTIVNINSGETRVASTTAEGYFTFPELPANSYRLTVEAKGFKVVMVEKIQVGVQVTRRADVQMVAGEVSESVTVSAGASLIQIDTPVKQLNVTEQQVRELPLLVASEAGGRSPLAFVFLDSSVTPTGSGGVSGTNTSNFRVNGGQGRGTDILIDGVTTRRGENGTFFSEVAPGPYAFQEFTVSTSQYSAEYGNSSGGVVNFTIKTGTNDFHGEGYFFLRNEAFNARPDFNRIIKQARPQDRQREYGFTIGGPIRLPRKIFGPLGYDGRNRTHFFFNYGGYHIDQQENVSISVPTLKMRQGDFSELLTDPEVRRFFGTGGVQIFNPYQRPGQRQAFAGNIIPQELLDPVGLAFVGLFPEPNQIGPNGSTVYRNYAATSVASASTNYYVGKVTQIINNKQTLNVSYIYRRLPSQKGGAPRFDAPFVAQGRWQQEFKSYYARAQHDWTLSPVLLNHFNAGFNRTLVLNRNYSSLRNNLSIGPQFDRGRVASDLGLPPGSTQNIGLPIVDIGGYGDAVTSLDPRSYQPGGSTAFDNSKADNTVQFTDYVSHTRGRQTFKFGGDVRFQQLNVSPRFDVGGNFQFRSNQTANTNENIQGWPVASLLLGTPSGGTNSLQTAEPAMRMAYHSVFIQDDIRLTSRLTINAGFRFDVNPPRFEARDRYRGFDPDVINTGRVTAVDTGGNPVQFAPINRRGAIIGAAGQSGLQADYRGLAKTDYSSFGPRIGFAYQLNNKTVVRGGYGLYYNPIAYNDQGEGGFEGYNPGQSNPSPGREALNSIAENGVARTPINLRNFPALPMANPDDQAIGILNRNIEFFDKNFQLGRTAQYSFGIQRELPFNMAIDVSYIGSRGTRLRSRFNPLNALPLEYLKLGDALLRKRVANLTATDYGYAQSLGIMLPANPDAVYPGFGNQTGNSLLAGTVAQSLRPFPQYGNIVNRLESQGRSWYNAVKIDLRRRFAQGFQYGVSYTFSKLITDAGEDLFGDSPINDVVQNPFERESLRTISPNTFPHSLVFNYVIELPLGKGKRFLNRGGLVDRLVGGFQVNGIHRYRSNIALTPMIGGPQREFLDLAGYGGNLRPNLTGQPFTTDANAVSATSYRDVNPAAFSRPPNFRGTTAVIGSAEYRAYYADPLRFFGNAAPAYDNLRARPFYNEDFSVLKKTRINETAYFEIRAEFFNLFNRSRFGAPGINLNDINPNNAATSLGNFGVSALGFNLDQPRRIQLGARIVF